MNPRFLVIDDDADIRALTEMMLGALGCEVITAASGPEGLAAMQAASKEGQFDAVFLDIMMPDMNGFEVLGQMKANPDLKEIPVLMLTAKEKPEDLINGYQLGADYYIPKPFTRSQLMFGLDLVMSPGDHKSSGPNRLFCLPE